MGRAYSCSMLNCWFITWPVGFKRLTEHNKIPQQPSVEPATKTAQFIGITASSNVLGGHIAPRIERRFLWYNEITPDSPLESFLQTDAFFTPFLRFCNVKLNESNIMKKRRQKNCLVPSARNNEENSSSGLRYLLTASDFIPLQTKRKLLYLKSQSVPRCKHFSSRL